MSLKSDFILKVLFKNLKTDNIKENIESIKNLIGNTEFNKFLRENRIQFEDTLKELKNDVTNEIYENIHKFFKELFEDVEGGKTPQDNPRQQEANNPQNTTIFPAINIVKDDNTGELFVEIVAPGFDYQEKEIKINVYGTELIIEGSPTEPDSGYEDILTEYTKLDFVRKVDISKFIKTHDFEKCTIDEFFGLIVLIVPPITEPVKKRINIL